MILPICAVCLAMLLFPSRKLVVVLLVIVLFVLTGCEAMMARTAQPFQGVTLGDRDHVRDVARDDLDQYRCASGRPLYAESWNGRRFDIDCRL